MRTASIAGIVFGTWLLDGPSALSMVPRVVTLVVALYILVGSMTMFVVGRKES